MDTPEVLLAEGQAGDRRWRLAGRRLAGEPCVSLVVAGEGEATTDRCGIRRTDLRHLVPLTSVVGGRLLVFSALEARARRVRLDHPDGTIRIEPAHSAAGFPARFFLVELDPADQPLTVRAFGDGGRAVVA